MTKLLELDKGEVRNRFDSKEEFARALVEEYTEEFNQIDTVSVDETKAQELEELYIEQLINENIWNDD